LVKTLEIDPNFWIALLTLAKVSIRQGEYREAMEALAKAKNFSGGNTQTISILGFACALSGDREQALAVLEELKALSTQRYVPPYNIAMVYNGLGEDEEALTWLERGHKVRDVLLSAFLTADPNWDRLRSNSRFMEIIKGMNLE
jgi:Flp pilus assembly protein TadD